MWRLFRRIPRSSPFVAFGYRGCANFTNHFDPNLRVALTMHKLAASMTFRSSLQHQPRTNKVTKGSSPNWRLQWPCTFASKVAPAGKVSAE